MQRKRSAGLLGVLSLLLAVAAIALLTTACGGDASVAPPAFGPAQEEPSQAELVKGSTSVGEIDALDAYIGLVVREDGTVIAYVCDGERVGFWASGKLRDNRALLLPKEGAGAVEVAFAEYGSATGTVRLPERSAATFSTRPAKESAGLYRQEAPTALTGWVVLADGRSKGTSANNFIIDRDAVFLSFPGGSSAGLLTHWEYGFGKIGSEISTDLRNSGSGCVELRVTWDYDPPANVDASSAQNCDAGTTIARVYKAAPSNSDNVTSMTVALFRNGQPGTSKRFGVGDAPDSDGTCDQIDVDDMSTTFTHSVFSSPGTTVDWHVRFAGTAKYTCNGPTHNPRSIVDGTLSVTSLDDHCGGVSCHASLISTFRYIDGTENTKESERIRPRNNCIPACGLALPVLVHAVSDSGKGIVATTVQIIIYDSLSVQETHRDEPVTKHFGDG